MRLRKRQKREARQIGFEKWSSYCETNPIPDPEDFIDNESHPLFEAVRSDPRVMKFDVQTVLLIINLLSTLYQLWSRWKEPEPSTVMNAEEWNAIGE